MLGEQQIGGNEHRTLILLSQIKRLNDRVKAIHDIRRRQDSPWIVALRSAKELIQVSLFSLRWQAGRGTAALYVDDHHRGLGHASQTNGLSHQRKAAAGGRTHSPHT